MSYSSTCYSVDKKRRETDKREKLVKRRHLLQSNLIAPITLPLY